MAFGDPRKGFWGAFGDPAGGFLGVLGLLGALVTEKNTVFYGISVIWVGKSAAKDAYGREGSENQPRIKLGGSWRLLRSSRGGPGAGKVHQMLCLSMFWRE